MHCPPPPPPPCQEGYVEHDSLQKLWHPSASFGSFEYSKTMNSHIVLIEFQGKLDLRENNFFNNTSRLLLPLYIFPSHHLSLLLGLGGPALSIKDQSYSSRFELIGVKKEIYISKNSFANNVGILSGSVLRIIRRGFDLGENYCGPIVIESNTFTENIGCRSNFGAVNIQCLFGSSSIESGIKKERDIQLV